MSEPKFTPGPWRVEVLGKDCLSVIIYADKGRPVASLYHERYKLRDQRANAALIAAAPEMYEKLAWMQKQFDDSDSEELVSLGWEIEDLLKKARGES